MFTERKVPLCYKRKEQPQEIMHEYLLPCNTNAMESYSLNKTQTQRNRMQAQLNRNATKPKKHYASVSWMQKQQNGNGIECGNGKMASKANGTGISLVYSLI